MLLMNVQQFLQSLREFSASKTSHLVHRLTRNLNHDSISCEHQCIMFTVKFIELSGEKLTQFIPLKHKIPVYYPDFLRVYS